MAINVMGKVLAESGEASDSFEGVRETIGRVIGSPPRVQSSYSLLESTRLHCRLSGTTRSALSCLGCNRFVNFRPSRDRRRVTIRCYWTGGDRVEDLMTPVSAMLAVPLDASVAEARRLAADYGNHHLVVVDGDMLVGVLSTQDLTKVPAEHRIRPHVQRKVWVTFPDSTLADAARIMTEHHVSCLLVVWERRLCGMLTRSDLLEVGWVVDPT